MSPLSLGGCYGQLGDLSFGVHRASKREGCGQGSGKQKRQPSARQLALELCRTGSHRVSPLRCISRNDGWQRLRFTPAQPQAQALDHDRPASCELARCLRVP